LQLALIRGRAFAANETPGDRVAVISETAAQAFWPDGDALGQRLDLPANILTEGDSFAPRPSDDANPPRTSVTVVGIARDTRVYDPWNGDRAVVYLPQAPQTGAAPYLLIRTRNAASPPFVAFQQVGREVTGIAPRVLTVDDLFARALIQYRVVAWIGGILAALSLIVAVIGLYGVMSFAVNQRVKEIGIRIALGATPGRVASGIVVEAMRLVGAGAVVGYGLSVVIALIARTLLFGVSAFDPLACGVVVTFLGAIGIFACWLPARRAAKVDPMVALRAE
jgi:putative ABC transport system permease protein